MAKLTTCKNLNLYLCINVYLHSSGTTLIAGILANTFTLSFISTLFHLLVVFPYAALVTIMACRVYRRTRMGTIRESEVSTTAIERSAVNGIPVAQGIIFNNNPTITDATVPHDNSHHDAIGSPIGTRTSAV